MAVATSFLALLLFVGVAASSASPERWISLTTPHFEMYTTNAEKDAVQELQFFEGVRSFFLQASPLKPAQETPVQIVAFRSESEFDPYGFRAGGGAYYLRTFNQDYIVLQDTSPKHRRIIAHEYTHLVVAHAGLKLPVWLNEGLAEVYSSLESKDRQIVVGRDPAQHLTTLSREQWIDWNTLFSAGIDSPYYNESRQMSIFYAQSWALAHMLAFGAGYSSHFNHFLQAVSGGPASAEVLQSVYGKNMAAIDADLRAYLRARPLPESVFKISLERSSAQPEIRQASEFQINFALATLLSARATTLAQSQSKLAALSAQYPENPATEESLGYLALQQDRTEEARAHFAEAVKRHSTNAEIIYRYAELEQDAGMEDTDVMALLQRAVAIKPDLEAARLELGLLAAKHSQCESTLSLLSTVKTIPGDKAFAVYLALGQCDLHLDHLEAAKSYAQKAKLAAKEEGEKQDVDDLLADIAGGKAAVPPKEGPKSQSVARKLFF